MNKIKCIYAIKDKRSDKVIYIGLTKDFKRRKSQHFNTVQRPIQKFMFEQSRENFEMIILEELSNDISIEEIVKKEDNYILKYNTIKTGLNKQRSGFIEISNKKQYKQNWCKEHKDKKKAINDKWIQEHKDEYDEYQREYQRKYYHKKKQEKLKEQEL